MYNFEGDYNKAVRKIRDLMEDIRFSRQLNLEFIQSYGEEIAKRLRRHDNILSMGFDSNESYPYILTHPVNVGTISGVIGKWLKLSEVDIVRLICSGLLHDIGKAKIRDSILDKPDKLSSGEMEIVRNHPLYGYQLLEKLNIFDEDILSGVLYHHEREDGSGYPNQLKGDEIPLFARIIAVADIYDAMTTSKSYKEKCSPFKVIGEIEVGRFEALDPKICQIFLESILNYYPGSKVRLSNDKVGTIICVNHGEYMRPVVYCGEEQFNLTEERDLEIVEILNKQRVDKIEGNSNREIQTNKIENQDTDNNIELDPVDEVKESEIEEKIV